jgi:hypothetical protein
MSADILPAAEPADAAVNPADPYERQAQTFPKLTAQQIERAKAFGCVHELPKGTVLFERGQRAVDFFIVLEGRIEIYEPIPDGPSVFAVFLSRHAAHVHVLVRGPGLAASMSDYLIGRIEAADRITLHTGTEIVALLGDRHLERVRWANRRTGEEETRAVSNVFCMLGAVPNTEWLDGCVALDGKGFVRCGERPAGPADGWDGGRAPFALETSRPGVFAVGDVRSGSVKRVASAVGEGSIAVPYIHQILAGA